jgi:hypothetical protein
MSKGQSQRSVASSTQHRQEAEVAAVEEHEQAAIETAAMAARTTRLVMSELAAERAEVEATTTVADAARAAAAELEALRDSNISSPDWRGRAGGAPGRDARSSRVLDGDGNPDRRGRASGWVDGDRGLYRRCGSPSPDR